MRYSKLILSSLAAMASPAAFAAIVVLTNPAAQVGSLTKAQLAHLYLGQPVSIKSTENLVPLDQLPASTAYQTFYQKIAGLSSAEVNQYWSNLTFSGQGSAPEALRNNSEVIRAVMQQPNMVGYINVQQLPSGIIGHVKVSYIIGHLTQSLQLASTTTALASQTQSDQTDNFATQLQLMAKKVARASASLSQRETTSAVQNNSLWSVLAKHFVLNVTHNKRGVATERRWFLRHPMLLHDILKNAGPYLYYVYHQTQQMRLPAELALLPLVESGYNPYAYSRAGATGLWQMMPATAESLGVKIDWWYDGRRDVIVSTGVALNYILTLYQQFHRWPLAIAAYDAGASAVSQAMRENQQLGKPTGYWQLPLPKETQSYFPKLLALMDIISHAKKYHVQLPLIMNKPYFSICPLSSQITLTKIATMAQMSMVAVQRLNPALRRWATDPVRPYDLILPTANAAYFKAALSKGQGKKQISWMYHQVRFGETLDSIAKNHHISPSFLRRVNGISGPVTLHEGLLVPVNLNHALPTIQAQSTLPATPFKQQPADVSTKHAIVASDSLKEILNKLHGENY